MDKQDLIPTQESITKVFYPVICMKKADRLHTKAMNLLDAAYLASRKNGDTEEACKLTEQAFRHEKAAASLVPEGIEPTRSVLYRSAASLALRCGKVEEAKELIAGGLAGDPPAEIEAELKELSDSLGQKMGKNGTSVAKAENGKEAVSGDDS